MYVAESWDKKGKDVFVNIKKSQNNRRKHTNNKSIVPRVNKVIRKKRNKPRKPTPVKRAAGYNRQSEINEASEQLPPRGAFLP